MHGSCLNYQCLVLTQPQNNFAPPKMLHIIIERDPVVIPTKIDWIKAENICSKLGDGNITELSNENDVNHAISIFDKMNTSCEYVWTPYVDEQVDGHFISSVTGKLLEDLEWEENQPNGGVYENNLAINIKSKLYNDLHATFQHCTACDLYKTTTFSLMGVCKDSYFGKFHPNINKIECQITRFEICTQQ